MAQQPASSNPRISLEAIRKLDDLARLFRRKLRGGAVQLLEGDRSDVVISPEMITEAIPLACRELLSTAGSNLDDQRGSDDRRPESA